MPKFVTPELPTSINVSYWNKKRELLSKTKPSGMTAAIEACATAYKKVNWKAFDAAADPGLDYSVSRFEACEALGKKIKTARKLITTFKSEINRGSYATLRNAATELHKTAKRASAMFAKEKYPKASKAAAEIAADAMTFSGSVNPISLEAFLDACDQQIVNDANNFARRLSSGSNLQNVVAQQRTFLKKIMNLPTPEARAKAYNKASTDEIARSTTQQIGYRVKVGYIGCDYPTDQAKIIFDHLTPFANSKKPVDNKTVDTILATIDKGLIAASRLPNNYREIV